MPQRFLRPGITNSERWNDVGFECQSLYIRLLTLVDDYGRCDGRPAVVLGQCFSVWNAQHPEGAVGLDETCRMLQQLAASRLIDIYEVEGKSVIEMLQWQERIREGTVSKWPENPQKPEVAASCSKLLLPSPPPSPTSPPTPLSELGVVIAKWFHRKPTTRWSDRELKLLRRVEALKTPRDEIELLEAYYFSNPSPYRRRDIETLLNNWNGEIDRARNYKSNSNQPTSAIDKAVLNRNLIDLEAKLRTIEGQYDSHQSWTAPDIAERKRLRGIIKELKTKLGIVQ